MKRFNRLKDNRDFQQVIQHGRSLADHNLVLYYLKSEDDRPYRVGISVGKRLGNAVLRNRIKRVIREVVRLNQSQLVPGIDLVIIARQGIIEKSYYEIEKSFINLLKRASLWKKNSMN